MTKSDKGKRVESKAFGYQPQVRSFLGWKNVGGLFPSPQEAWAYLDRNY